MHYEPTRKSVDEHEVPRWYHDAKFGIFIHWSLSCVPAFAPRGKGTLVDIIRKEGVRAAFEYQPYSEWYLNSLRIKGTPVYEHHLATYGEGYDYYRFADAFNEALELWDPDAWADLFRSAGAKYVVLVAKHHDGFLLWPSEHPNPKRPGLHASRDVVGELTDSVRAGDMRMGYYYSSPYDWTFTTEPIRDLVDGAVLVPTDETYLRYIDAHWRELIDRHEPSVLWSDIGYPPGPNVNELFACYYNRVPDGVVNDRWSQMPLWARRVIRSRVVRPPLNRMLARSFVSGVTSSSKVHSDFMTPEYTSFKETSDKKWECTRGMGASFGYNRQEVPADYITVTELVHLLMDIVSKNGNLLLNVGPMPGGKIPDIQVGILNGIGAWLEANGEAVFGTRPWVRPEGATAEDIQVRFTQKGGALYASVLGRPGGDAVVFRSLQARQGTAIDLLGVKGTLEWSQRGDDLEVKLSRVLPDQPACVFKIYPAPAPAPIRNLES